MKKILLSETKDIPLKYETDTLKEKTALNWLIAWHKAVIENNIAQFGDIIPSKSDIAKHLNFSQGTIQNAVKYAEDMGYFVSRQCVGTIIVDPFKKNDYLKMSSKKDKTLVEIKKLLCRHGYIQGEIIPTIHELALELKVSINTIRLALFELIKDDIIKKEVQNKNTLFILNKTIEIEDVNLSEIKNKTLVKITKENIKKYLNANLKKGDKTPTNAYFAKYFKVSIRTVNSAVVELNKEKILLSRRGRYGTIFINKSAQEGQKSHFMSNPKNKGEIQNHYFYKWEIAYNSIVDYIIKNHETGDKIPSIREFAKIINLKTAPVKKAVTILCKEKILYAQKGKFGGLFINEMPQKGALYTWLAINPTYFEN